MSKRQIGKSRFAGKWNPEQSHPQAGIRFDVQFRSDADGGNLGRIAMWDGRKVGRVVHTGNYDDARSLYREMVRTAAQVGPWA